MFTVKIRWGSIEPTEPFEYEFKTEAERDAFLYGVEESSGWMDYEIVEDDDVAETNRNGAGMNTLFTYIYRDASNYKTSKEVVFAGEYAADDLELIASKLEEDGVCFIPSQVGLDDLQHQLGKPSDDDHVWHEWGELEYGVEIADTVELTDRPANTPVSWAELVQSFRELEGWDIAAALDRNDISA